MGGMFFFDKRIEARKRGQSAITEKHETVDNLLTFWHMLVHEFCYLGVVLGVFLEDSSGQLSAAPSATR